MLSYVCSHPLISLYFTLYLLLYVKSLNVFFHFWMFMSPTNCPWNGFSFFVSTHSYRHIHPFSLFAAAAISYPVLSQWLFLSPVVCLSPSLSLSVYLSPSPSAASLLGHGAALSSLCLPVSLILLTGNNNLSSLSPSLPPPSLYLAGYIRSSVCCLGLWQPVSYSKWFWHSCLHVSVSTAVTRVSISVYVVFVSTYAQSD